MALDPLGYDGNDVDGDDRAEHGKLISDLFRSPHSGLTSLYFSVLVGCLSTLTSSIKSQLNNKLVKPIATQPVSKIDRTSPPPSKRTRLAESCPYSVSDFDIILLLDNGTRIPANREAVAGVEGAHGVGSEYFRALIRGGFQEAQSNTEEAIRIKNVSTGMLLPVVHYLHGCRLTGDTESLQGGDEEERRGQCQVLDTLVTEGLSFCQKETKGHIAEDFLFQKTPLGEIMIGACRFLVTELQRELQDRFVSCLLSCSTDAAGPAVSAPSEDSAEKGISKMDQKCLELAEESLANRTCELELIGVEMRTENLSGQKKKTNCFLQKTDDKKPSSGTIQKANRAPRTTSEQKTIKSVTPVSKPSCLSVGDKSLYPEGLRLSPKNLMNSSSELNSTDVFPSEVNARGGVLAALLPQVYWFSQRYSYPALGRACLSLLLGCQDCPQPFLSSSIAGSCLRRLASEADCRETLKQDLVSLVTGALS